MKIEKVSRYVPVVTGLKSKGATSGSTIRHMLISIPKIKFLEGGETEFYHKYKELGDNPFIESPSYTPQWVDSVKKQPLTERELIVEQMVNDGKTQQSVADRLGIERGSVANLLNRVRVKRAYQALSDEQKQEQNND